MGEWPQAEQATLAAAIRDPGFRATVLDAGAEVFTHEWSQRAWRALQELTQAGRVVDAATVEMVLGHPITAAPATDYWPVLLDQRLRRQLDALGRWLTKSRPGVSAQAVAARALQSLDQAITATQTGAIVSGGEAVQAGMHHLLQGDPHWLRFGVPTWDATAAAWGPDDFVLVGARPSQGKTALGVQWAWQTARTGRGVAFCSVEMSPAAIGLRAVGQVTERSKEDLRRHPHDLSVVTALGQLAQWPWRVIDANGAGVADLQAAVARADVQGPRCEVVIIDYLQLLRPATRLPNREQEVARMVAGLKAWARRDHRLVVVLTQLKRTVEDRPDRVPTLADLRESGAQEQDADAVVLIHHPEDGAVDLIVAKNRNGPTGRVPLRWYEETARFGPI